MVLTVIIVIIVIFILLAGIVCGMFWMVSEGLNQRYKDIYNFRNLTPDEIQEARKRILEYRKQRKKEYEERDSNKTKEDTGCASNDTSSTSVYGSDVDREADSHGIPPDIQ